MKPLKTIIYFGFICSMFYESTPVQAASLKNITIAFESIPSPPFYYGKGSHVLQKYPGLLVEQIIQAGQMSGVSIEFVRMPWKRILHSLKNGYIDGAFSASYKVERDKYAAYPEKGNELDISRCLTDQTYVFYKRVNSKILEWDGQNLNITNPPIVGTKRGYSIASDVKVFGVTVEEVATTEQNLGKVLAGRIAAYAGLERMVDSYLKKNPNINKLIEKVSPPLKKKPYFLIFNDQFYEKNKVLSESIWNNITQIKTSPDFKRLKSFYENIQ